MSGHAAEPSTAGFNESELEASQTEGYTVGVKKSVAEYAELDKEDESLAKWKASLGIAPGGAAATDGPRVSILSLSLVAESRPGGPIEVDLQQPAEVLAAMKKNPVTIKEGAEYHVEIKFKTADVVTGLRYIQVVKRSGIQMDKLESMIGSYGPTSTPIAKQFVSETAPSGMIARSGTYNVRSRVIDDDKHVWADWEWCFKLGKDW